MSAPDVGGRKVRTLKKKAIDLNPPVCTECGKDIPPPRRYRGNVRYCSDKCRIDRNEEMKNQQAALRRLQAASEKLKVDELAGGRYPDSETRKGPAYDAVLRLLDPRILEEWVDRQYTDREIAVMAGLNYASTTMAKVRHQLFNERLDGITAVGYQPAAHFAKLLGPDEATMRTLARDHPDKFDLMLDKLVAAFVAWRDSFFRTGRGGYITKAVHRKWIKTILRTIYLGERTLILSPPRHGKTDLLVHFCVWQIIRNPQVKILWIGPNSDIGENCLGQVKDLLESHDDLRNAYLAPGQSWAPTRRGSGNLWARSAFTVMTRPLPEKTPTMWATGVGGTILSLDADFMVIDDPADPDKSFTPGGRAKIENWLRTKVITRKMDHTGLAMISSRVHPSDLYSELTTSYLWDVVIDRAHDQLVCGLDLFADHTVLADPDACVLFPEINPLRYLREQHDDVGPALFEMMYLNQPRVDGTAIFNIDTIRNLCIRPARVCGIANLPANTRLIAGLDPAATGVQAAFCWGVHEGKDVATGKPRFEFYMIDMETQQGGGLEGALSVMERWHAQYGLRLWVVEDNAFQAVIHRDLRVKKLASDLGLTVRSTTTGKTKNDPRFGVAQTAPHYHEGRVHLPTGDLESKRKVEMFLSQLTNFTGDPGPTRRGKSDVLMAAYFPFATIIRNWIKEAAPPSVTQDDGLSYPGYRQTTYDSAPWGETGYPQAG